jgi:hypothetical protein
LRNNSAAQKSVSLALPALNDTVYYWVFDPANEVPGWTAFPPSLDLTIPAGESQKLRLGVKRAGLTADSVYAANMTVSDAAGMQILVPVSVTGISYSGLWVGDATISKVSEPLDCIKKDLDPNNVDDCPPVKTGSEFSFRLILHAGELGPVRLLSHVIQMWQEGTWKPDPNDLGKLIVDEPGHFVLLVDDALIPLYSGAALRDGQPVGRRISSPAFGTFYAEDTEPFITKVNEKVMASSGVFGQDGATLTVTLGLPKDDPTNPFRHMYHPDHKLAEQSYTVTRIITLEFAEVDPEGRPITGVPTLGWGSSEIGGRYEETITGLHKNTLHIEGTFLLHKVSSVGTLTQ